MMPKDVEVGKEILYENQEWLVTKRVDNPGYAVIQRGGEEKRIPYGKLKLKKQPKVTRGMQRLEAEQKGLVPNYKGSEQYKNRRWHPEDCSPGALEKYTPHFVANSRLRITSSNPHLTAQEFGVDEQCIESCADTSHGAKFDVVVKDCPELVSAPSELKMFFNPEGHSCHNAFEVQIGYREFAEYLMSKGLKISYKGETIDVRTNH